MSEKNFGKLVRDGVPGKLEAQGREPSYKRLKGVEFFVELKEKLVEEANEVANAGSRSEIIKELADLQEVRDEILKIVGASQEEVNEAQMQRREEVGGFENRIFLESVS